MNVERLHAIMIEIKAEFEQAQVVSLASQLTTSLQQLAANPGDAAAQQQVSSFRTQLDEILRVAPSNNFSPAWRRALEELGVVDLLGDPLRAGIQAIFERNEITPSAAVDELTPITERIRSFDAAIDMLLGGFRFFGIGAEELEPGEFEVGFLIPRERVDNELKALGEEFVNLHRILAPFVEVGTGSRPNLEVRSIASSAFEVFLNSPAATAACIAVAVEKILQIYQQILDIRLSHQKLKDQGVPAERLDGVAEYAEGIMDAGIDEIIEEVLSDVGRAIDDARRNELRVELRLSMRSIANRIDRGYYVEVRAGELPEGTDDASEADEEALRLASVVAEKQAGLRYMKLTGDPILSLPEAADEGDGEDQAD